MKHLTKIFYTVVLSFVLIGMSACQHGDDDLTSTLNGDGPFMAFESPDFYVDVTGDMAGVTDLTLEDDMTMHPLGYDPGNEHGQMRRHDRLPRGNFMFLGRIFYKLNLSDAQKAGLKDMMKDFWQCKRGNYDEETIEARKAIIAAANEARKAIIEQIKDGSLPREEARDALRQISKDTREQLRELIDQDAKCKCLLELFADIRESLTEDQQEIWDKWVATLKGPCFEE